VSSAPSGSTAPFTANTKGIALVCLAVAMFACMDAIAKYLTATLPVLEVVWARYMSNLVLILIVFGPTMGRRLARTRRPIIQLGRGLLLPVATLSFIAALKFMPLAEASALGYVAPLFVTLLSVPILKERVGPRRWAAVVVGFIGVLVIVRPGGTMQWATLLPLVTAAAYSIYQILTRLVSRDEHPVTSLFHAIALGAVVTTAALPWVWQTPPTVFAAILLGLTGLFGGIGHLALIKAFEMAPASILAPLGYTQIIWTMVLGYVVFGDFPDATSLLGIAIIVGSGIYILWREKVTARAAKPPAA
jgi:drug/metabolite transporter (DMT)-like permease